MPEGTIDSNSRGEAKTKSSTPPPNLPLSLFDYHLPKEKIAKYPPKVRGRSKLMVLYTNPFEVQHKCYCDIPDYIQKGDLVVLNNTRVIKARLFAVPEGKKSKVEVLLLSPYTPLNLADTKWEVLIGGAKKLKNSSTLLFEDGSTAKILQKISERTFLLQFSKPALQIAHKIGHTPIPKYLRRSDEPVDYERYNTVFSKVEGSVAAPTASLNLTPGILKRIKQKATVKYVTLYIGWGTFAPINTPNVADFKIHSEFAILPKDTAEAVNQAKLAGKNIVAFGTTVTRVLEGVATLQGVDFKRTFLSPYEGNVDIFIYPGYKFKVVSRLVTNFHAPKSSVFVLACAFVGIKNLKRAYKIALREGYRFLSYGDTMFLAPRPIK